MYICMYSLLPEINRPTKETTNSPTLIDNISREDRFVITKIYAKNSMPSFQIKLREIDYSSILSATNLNRFLGCSITSAKVHIIPVFHSGKLNQFTESVNDACQLALKAIKRKNELCVQSIKVPTMCNSLKYKEYKNVLSKPSNSEREYEDSRYTNGINNIKSRGFW